MKFYYPQTFFEKLLTAIAVICSIGILLVMIAYTFKLAGI